MTDNRVPDDSAAASSSSGDHPAGTLDARAQGPLYPTGYGLDCPCPACGERLWVYIPTDPGIGATVMRYRDIPTEDDGTDDSAGDRAGAAEGSVDNGNR